MELFRLLPEQLILSFGIMCVYLALKYTRKNEAYDTPTRFTLRSKKFGQSDLRLQSLIRVKPR